jgi:AraC-like DNA-binding protein
MWNYRRVGAIELASCAGNALPDLRPHFHETAQLCLVQSGKRRAETRYGIVEVAAGECLYLPAGLPHRFTDSATVEGRCLNIYAPLDLGAYPRSLPAVSVRPLLQSLDLSGPSLSGSERSGTQSTESENGPLPIQALARAAGVSREHFSRTFVQQHGLPPHRYRIMCRLNAARQAIARGHSLADVAVRFDFADQSHLSRLFRQTFGTTPGAYRKGC